MKQYDYHPEAPGLKRPPGEAQEGAGEGQQASYLAQITWKPPLRSMILASA